MTIGDWSIDDAGMITHLKCRQPASSWAHQHRCWVDAGYCSVTWQPAGKYTEITAPEMVCLIAKIRYDIWAASRKSMPW